MTDDYSYIFTAKHTLYEDPETMKIPIKNHILKGIITELEFIKEYEHDTLDIAILKIKKVCVETPLKEFKELVQDGCEYKFYGYPNYKDEEKNDLPLCKKLENYTLKFNIKSEYSITFDNPSFQSKEEIEGSSGGGIFKEVSDDQEPIFLSAIEIEMNEPENSTATHQRINAIDIKVFDEIIKNNNEELEYIGSPQLLNFKFFEEKLLNKFDKSIVDLLKDEIKLIDSKNITPFEIVENIKEKLFYPFSDIYQDKVHYEELWEGWLLYLILVNIYLDGDLKKENITNLDKKNIYPLFLENKTNTINKTISDIIKSGDNYFKSESSIIFNTKYKVNHKNFYYDAKKIPRDISNVSSSDDEKLKIDRAYRQAKLSFIILNSIENEIAKIDKTTKDEIKSIIEKVILNKQKGFLSKFFGN
jgi:hypothetical protein